MIYQVVLNGSVYEVEVTESDAVLQSITPVVAPAAAPASAPVAPVLAASTPSPEVSSGTPVTAPMPGTIVSIKVAAGNAVKAGQVLAILEAMKMENEIAAPTDGVIKQVVARKDATVAVGDVLFVL